MRVSLSTIFITAAPFLLILIVFMLGGALAAKLDRAGADHELPQPLPQLAGLSNYGIITQTGPDLAITGNPHWSARGTIRKDGTVLLIWTEIETGRPAFGIYVVKGRLLDGEWGYADHVKLDMKGRLENRDPNPPEDDEDYGIDTDLIYPLKQDHPSPLH